MTRPSGALNRASRGEEEAGLNKRDPEEIKAIDREVLDGMSKLNRMRLTHVDADSLTLRQKQAAGAEFLAGTIGHPEIRRRIIEEGLRDPMTLLKIASSERPKEIHLEAEIQHSVVVVPAQMTAAEWDAEIKTLEGEVIKEEGW
jgi:hypothetical protein